MPKSGGGGICWSQQGEITDASSDAWGLAEMSEATGYIVIVLSSPFGIGGQHIHIICIPTKTNGAAYSVGGDGVGGGKKISWRKL